MLPPSFAPTVPPAAGHRHRSRRTQYFPRERCQSNQQNPIHPLSRLARDAQVSAGRLVGLATSNGMEYVGQTSTVAVSSRTHTGGCVASRNNIRAAFALSALLGIYKVPPVLGATGFKRARLPLTAVFVERPMPSSCYPPPWFLMYDTAVSQLHRVLMYSCIYLVLQLGDA